MKAFPTKLWGDDEAFMSVSAASLHLSVSLDDVVNLRVEGIGELLLAGVLTLQAQCTPSDKERVTISVFHILFHEVKAGH